MLKLTCSRHGEMSRWDSERGAEVKLSSYHWLVAESIKAVKPSGRASPGE